MLIRLVSASKFIRTAVVALGNHSENEISVPDPSVSRRHAVVVNYPDEVWLYDLGSARGTICDGRGIAGGVFLDGVHGVSLGRAQLRISANARLLV
ncbi:FHA domain-containing protein [Hydrocarboniphaga sp.]|uniref:FHA domain-containing protein n=1 Tax=Hydrocarboniphaga sp. TaxID=2033016 RepID=UPI003D0C5F3E